MTNLWNDEYIGYDDSYTYPSYAPKKKSSGGWKSKYGGGGWSRSSWSSFSFVVEYEDDNSKLFVKDPINYITPTSVDIKKKVRATKQSSIDLIKELTRVCYFKMIDETDYISESFVDFDSLNDSDKGTYQSKKPLLDSVYNQYIPGFTPLEQAIAIYLKIQKDSEDGDKSEDEDVDLDKCLEFDRDLYADPDINEQLELNELSKDRKMEILNLLSLVGQFGTEFKVEKEVNEKIVANSDQFLKMIMRSYDQMVMVDIYQRLLPNFDVKFLTKDLTVNVPVDRKEQKQKIIIILDYSGSMSYDNKQTWVNGILIDRFKYVMRGEAEVFFSYFVHRTEDLEFQHIKDRADVINFWQTFSNDPSGGNTEVGEMVTYIAEQISEKRLHNLDIDLSQEKPEILIINDGQDSINIDEFPYKVNAITLMEYSDELKDLCIKSGGKLIEVNQENQVYSYSEEAGKQEITKK